jgi:4-diphosphocytidyl-2-C-methyl-D-erythritol kinase
VSPRAARLDAQAKVNLFLRVLSREASGYHQLETLFQRISLADTVTVRTGVAGRSLDCAGASLGPAEQNLAWRAALAFVEATGGPSGFSIEIDKRIPVGGGLGGGSADAGAVLRLLTELAPRPVAGNARVELAALATRLGADVPFLAAELPLAIGLGRGERLLPLAPLPEREVMLCVPPFGVSSAEAFRWYAAERAGHKTDPHLVLPSLARLSWAMVARHAENDLEGPVFARHPELATIRQGIEGAGATIARMTGSGSTLFGVFEAERRPGPLALPAACTVLHVRTVDRVAAVELL